MSMATTSGICTLCITQDKYSGKILMIKSKEGDKPPPLLWKLPGGNMDLGDKTCVHAAQRELHEETGIVVCLNQLHYKRTFKKRGHDVILYAVTVTNPKINIIDEVEVADARMFSVKEITSNSADFLAPHLGYLRQLDYI